MTTKFDVDDIVYVPMKVLCIGISYRDGYPEYRLRPIWRGNEADDLFSAPETQILNREDVLNANKV